VDDGHGRNIAEVDVFLGNREFAMAVEVKTKLTQDHVDEHLKRMECAFGPMSFRKPGNIWEQWQVW
jgi:hypothetical protein